MMKDIPYIVYETAMWHNRKLTNKLIAVIIVQAVIIAAGWVAWVLTR